MEGLGYGRADGLVDEVDDVGDVGNLFVRDASGIERRCYVATDTAKSPSSGTRGLVAQRDR